MQFNGKIFSKSQVRVLSHAYYELGFKDEEMACMMRKEYDPCVMWQIMDYFVQNEGEDAVNEFRSYYEPYIQPDKFSSDQIVQIMDGLDAGLTSEQVDIYAKPCYNDLQMEEIKEGILCGLTPEELNKFLDPNLSPMQMGEMREEILSTKN